MSAYPTFETADQRTLPGILTPPIHVPTGSVEPQANGNAKLLFDGEGVGVYASPERANEGLEQFRRMGLCT